MKERQVKPVPIEDAIAYYLPSRLMHDIALAISAVGKESDYDSVVNLCNMMIAQVNKQRAALKTVRFHTLTVNAGLSVDEVMMSTIEHPDFITKLNERYNDECKAMFDLIDNPQVKGDCSHDDQPSITID